MTTETLVMIAGALLSLGFSYIPGLAGWYARLGQDPAGGDDGGVRKRLVMLSLLVCAAGGSFALACSGWGAAIGLRITCDRTGLAGLIQALVLAVMANQSTFKLTPKAGVRRPATAG